MQIVRHIVRNFDAIIKNNGGTVTCNMYNIDFYRDTNVNATMVDVEPTGTANQWRIVVLGQAGQTIRWATNLDITDILASGTRPL